MKLCILYGGTSSEREVSIASAESIYRSILSDYDIKMYDFNGNYDELYNNIKDKGLIFNALHGGEGEDGTIQKFLESENMTFTGSDSYSSRIAMNKIECKKICLQNKIPTPDWEVYEKNNINLDLPFVIKPSNEGSSIGLSIVENNSLDEIKNAIDQCLKVSKNILVEKFIKGRELTVGILDGEALPIVEIIPKGNFYDYNCKYTKGESDYIVPARIDESIKRKIEEYSIKIHELVGCGFYSRIDYRLKNNNEIYFLEINTLPGFTDTSLFPKAALEAGLNYKELINKIIKLSL